MQEREQGILIADDDGLSGRLIRDLLEEAGFRVYLLAKSIDLIPAIKRYKPDLVIMDITLAGIDGLKLIGMIKDDKETAGAKIVVASEKAFEFEKQQAFKHGVEAFIRKPFNVETLASQINHILSGNKQSISAFGGAVEEEEMAGNHYVDDSLTENKLRMTVWGCRGLSPVLPNSESIYGRQTSCVSLETRDHIVILDGGTGIIPLGESLLRGNRRKDIWLLLTHFHLDHVMGLPYFPCLGSSAYTIRIAGAASSEAKFTQTVRELFYASPWWHVKHPKAKILMYEVLEDTYELAPGLKIRTMPAGPT